MKTKLLVSALLLATAVVVYAYPLRGDEDNQPAPVAAALVAAIQQPRPVVEVVFVLDTTGSMSGLIEAAKNNIWSIARTMASAQPQPEIRVGLVAYRDRGDDYVTRVVDLSDDLDSMYATLMDFNAGGGGDGPEAVNEALFDAVHKIGWSQNPAAYQVIFLVGDAQAHMDYPDDVKYPDTVQAAAARGIIVNTIQAGDDPATHGEWLQIAQLSRGAFFKVGQQGDAIAVATPFDADMAKLSKQLDDTRLFYGDAKTRERGRSKTAATDKLNEGGSVGSLAQRAAFNTSRSGARNFLGDSELVEDVANGRVDLATIDQSELPEPLRELSTDEQRSLVMDTKGKRDALSKNIARLAEQRQQYIEGELSKDARVGQSLDYQIFGAVKEQAAKKGLSYESAPAH
jgi:Mg-chelatase subunit ChlD